MPSIKFSTGKRPGTGEVASMSRTADKCGEVARPRVERAAGIQDRPPSANGP